MKKGKIKFFIIFLIILLSFNFCKAEKSLIKTDIEIEIHEDLTFDMLMTQNMDTNYWSTKDWVIGLDKNMQNVIISDSAGLITPKETSILGEDYKQYTIDTHYGGSSGYKPVYIKSTGNSLERVNDYMYRVNLLIGIYKGELSNNNVTFTFKFPNSMYFLKSTEKTSPLTVSYYDPNGYFSFMFLSGLNNLTRINEENKIYFIENTSLLVNGTEKALKNRDCILNYPLKRDVIIISLGNVKELINDNNSEATGVYKGEGWIALDKNYYKSKPKEERISITVLHELTHYSNSFEHEPDNYPKWLEEGSAVYSSIKYIERNFDVNNLSDATELNLYNVRTKPQILKYWYGLNKNFYETNYSYNISGGDLYSLYGFVINHYAKTYGEAAIISSLNDIRELVSLENKSNTSERELNYAAIKSLIANSKSNISEEDIFFPNRTLFIENYSKFEEQMSPFTMPSTMNINYPKLEMGSILTLIIGIITVIFILGVIIILPILIIIFVVKKISSKNKKP